VFSSESFLGAAAIFVQSYVDVMVHADQFIE
jgi:hypothetical protein